MLPIDKALAAIGASSCGIAVNTLTLDSRAIAPGSAFIAIKGHQLDGSCYIESAINNGAELVLVDSLCEHQPKRDNVIVVNQLADQLSILASVFYNYPSRKFKLVGVTGTNGKSTVTSMIADLASSERCKAGVIGTLGWGDTAHLSPLANTTPSAVELQNLFSQMRNYSLVAMEVSSHGLVQKRVDQTDFDVAVFTNLSRDHLDYHGTMQAYGEAKLTLLTEFSTTANIVNYDDPVVREWLLEDKITNPVCFGEDLPKELIYPYISFDKARYNSSGLSCELRTSWGNAAVTLPLFGKFNLYNLAAALGALLNLAYDFDWLIDKIGQLNAVVGRMQAFSADHHPTCIVDYAHTPDALKQALEALSLHVSTNITCVFGCGGDRDKGKRALMADVAEQYADLIIVTNDNPRTEAEENIVNDILKGFKYSEAILVEYDRAQAIKLAIEQTANDGIILIAGKGHEDYQIYGTEKVFFSDSLVAQQILKGEKL